MFMGGGVHLSWPSHEREAPDSFPFATCASLACILSSVDLWILLPCPQSHIPPDPRFPCSLPSLTKRHSPFPFQNFSSESLSIRSLFKFKFISSARLSHPIPILSF